MSDELVDALDELEQAALSAAETADGRIDLASRLFETWAHTTHNLRVDLETEGEPDVPTITEYLEANDRA